MENRTVLFLYPQLESVDTEERDDIIRIISDLKLVISEANRQIGKILQQEGNFSYIRCLPNIEMEEANKYPSKQNIDFVRVCVLGYDDKDYANTYNNICEQYAKNTLEISHLIGLKINTQIDIDSIKFYKQTDDPFDVIIESNLYNLVALLISIMLDTSLYHYFSLNNDIKYRKNFSSIKTNGIKSSSIIEKYHISDITKIKYLPFSYPYIMDYFLASPSSKEKVINKLLVDYFNFIKKYVCQKLDYNKRKEEKNPYVKISDDTKSALQKIVRILDSKKMYIIAIKNEIPPTKDLIKNEDYFVVEDNEDAIKNWLLTFISPLNKCSLFYIKIGD